jgi:hypothetical protein
VTSKTKNLFRNYLTPVAMGGVVLFFVLGQENLSAQTALRNPRQDSAMNQSLSQDVTRPYGEYNYVPQTGLYKDLSFGDRVDILKEGVRNAGDFMNNINLMTGWSQLNSDGFSSTLVLGAGPFRLPGAMFSYGSAYYGTAAGRLQLRAGPFIVDNIYAAYGILYADISGNYTGKNQLGKNRWGQIVYLSFRASMSIGDSIGISIQPYLYWLPDKGLVGWGLPGPLASFLGYQPNAAALLQVAWNQQIGNWNYTLFDSFNPRIYQFNLWDMLFTSQPSFGNLTPIERVGRYSLGSGAGDITNYNPQTRFGVGNPSTWNGMAGYYNVLGARAVGTHGVNTHSLFYLYRTDYWDSKFRNDMSGLAGGGYIRTGDNIFTTYAGYSFYKSLQPDYKSIMNWAVVGAKLQIDPTTQVYGQVGGYWWTGSNRTSGFLTSLGIMQRLGARTTHYFEVGRRVYTPVTGVYGVQNYVDYRISHLLGSNSTVGLFVGISATKNDGGVSSDMSFKYVGANFTTNISEKTSVFASSGWVYTSTGSGAYVFDSWTHRLGLRHYLGQSIQAQAVYQHQDVSANSNNYSSGFSENFLYIGIAKQF